MRRVGASVSRLATFPLPARRTGRADFPHHGSHPGSCPSPTEGPPLPVPAGAARSPALVRGAHVSPAPARRSRRSHRSGRPAVPDPTAPPGDATRRAASPFASACSAIRSPRALHGGPRLSPLSTALSSFLRSSRTKAPSLRRSYPASPLLRAHPPPCRPWLALAGSRLARARHRQGFPCCCSLPLPCVLAPIPRRKRIGACVAHFPTRRRPSPCQSRVGFRSVLFEACSAFTRVLARRVAEPPKAALFHQSAPAHVVTSMNRSSCYQPERQLLRGIRTH